MERLWQYISLAALCLVLQGCVVGAAVDLVGTTVLTAGKIAVKGTGAVVRAAIPDGDSEEEKREKAEKKAKKEQAKREKEEQKAREEQEKHEAEAREHTAEEIQ